MAVSSGPPCVGSKDEDEEDEEDGRGDLELHVGLGEHGVRCDRVVSVHQLLEALDVELCGTETPRTTEASAAPSQLPADGRI